MPAGNDEQIEYWNGSAADGWVRAQERLDRMLRPMTDLVLSRARVQAGEAVIDVGCGCGETSLEMADRGASVLGVDISQPMLAHAAARAGNRAGIRFEQADAARFGFDADHDLVFSRYGIMFFDNPVAAFANLRGALATGGRLCFICWQSPAENAWVNLAARAVQPLMPPPVQSPDPRAPGPFAFAEAAYVQDILAKAGFSDVGIHDTRAGLTVGTSVADAVSFMVEIGPMSRALRELPAATQTEATTAVTAALEPYATSAGVTLDAACWIVEASA